MVLCSEEAVRRCTDPDEEPLPRLLKGVLEVTLLGKHSGVAEDVWEEWEYHREVERALECAYRGIYVFLQDTPRVVGY